MTNTAPLGYEAEPTDVAALLADALGDIPNEPDPTIRFARLGALGALYDAVVSGIADERGKAAAELAAQGRSFQQVADALGLGSRSRAQQYIERGRPFLSAAPVEEDEPEWILETSRAPGTLEGLLVDYGLPRWSMGSGEGWETSIVGPRSKIEALAAYMTDSGDNLAVGPRKP